VYEKTGGNPFFAIQFITALAEEGLLAFDPVAPAWRWDMDRIRAKGYTDNVVDLMVEKLKRLSGFTQEALKLVACLGNVAEVATLVWFKGTRRRRFIRRSGKPSTPGSSSVRRAPTNSCTTEFSRRHIP
jgi:hypothetical protein